MQQLAVIDGVDGNGIPVEVADVEQAVIVADDGAHRPRSQQMCAADLVVACEHFGNRIRAEVADENFSSIGLEGKVHGRLADVEQSQ